MADRRQLRSCAASSTDIGATIGRDQAIPASPMPAQHLLHVLRATRSPTTRATIRKAYVRVTIRSPRTGRVGGDVRYLRSVGEARLLRCRRQRDRRRPGDRRHHRPAARTCACSTLLQGQRDRVRVATYRHRPATRRASTRTRWGRMFWHHRGRCSGPGVSQDLGLAAPCSPTPARGTSTAPRMTLPACRQYAGAARFRRRRLAWFLLGALRVDYAHSGPEAALRQTRR
jgi:hypothetical protein